MSSNDKNLIGALPVMKRVKKSLGEGHGEPIDLDMTPVMNLFMVLIPFLMSMAVFTQLAIIEFSLPPAQTNGGETEQSKELDISIVVSHLGFRIVGSGKKMDLIPKVADKFQFEKLRALLKAIKFQYPSQTSVILIFDANTLYDDIIKFMDICKESQLPDIGLSGDIG
jgi:biopolymer transport protein ExbD